MNSMDLNLKSDDRLFDMFEDYTQQAADARRAKKAYKAFQQAAADCAQELMSRGYTMQEVIDGEVDPTFSLKSISDDRPIDTGFTTPLPRSKGQSKTYQRCAHTHPHLKIGKLSIQGGSCYEPHGPYEQYDVEIALCGGKSFKTLLPWETQCVLYPITDGQPPKNKERFDKLIDWTVEQMEAGKTVHVGCIGGHGRTGVFLSVLVHRITGRKDATEWVRKNYCKKVVESKAQVDWLFDNYGIEKVKPSKGDLYGRNVGKPWKTSKYDKPWKSGTASARYDDGDYRYDGHRAKKVPKSGASLFGKDLL